MEKVEHILDMALVTLETYDGPRYMVHKVNKATRKSIYLYQINAELIDASDEFHECNIVILYEPWMKANCIAQASFQFVDDESESKIVVRRNEDVPYYRNEQVVNGELVMMHERSYIPRRTIYNTSV